MKEETLHEYRLYKSWVRSRVTWARGDLPRFAAERYVQCKHGGVLQCLLVSVFTITPYMYVSVLLWCLLLPADLQNKFRCLGVLVEVYLTMAVSTAVCERGFSCMKRVQSDWRSSLRAVQLSHLMYVLLKGPSLASFEPLENCVWRGERAYRPNDANNFNEAEIKVLNEYLCTSWASWLYVYYLYFVRLKMFIYKLDWYGVKFSA